MTQTRNNQNLNKMLPIRIGFGVDVHQLSSTHDLFVGGKKIDSDLGAVGHSDADVLLHAITEAIIGALGKGDIGTLNTWDVNKVVESVISDGYMTPVNVAEFDSTRLTIKSETANLNTLTATYSNARTAVMTKYDNALAVIKTSTNNALDFENNRYQQELAALEAQQAQSESFILAAKRASKDYKNFDKAFSTALAFEHNRAQLTEIVDLPWTAFTSLRSLNTLSKVLALVDFADSVAAKYTMTNALKLNKSVGDTFTKTPTFVTGAKKAKTLYVKMIKS